MRVLHVSRFFHPHLGGTENFIAELAAAVAPHGVESAVLCTDRYADEPGPQPQLPVTRVRVRGPDTAPVWPLSRGRAAALRWAELVHLHDVRLLPWVAAIRPSSERPLVISSHGFIFHTNPGSRMKRLVWETYFRLMSRGVDALHCVSERDRSFIPFVPDEKVVVIPPGVRTSAFHGPLPCRSTALGQIALIYFGRLAPNKGLERLEPLLRANPGWSLSVVGRGDEAYERTLKAHFASVAGAISWRGSLSQTELVESIADHDCIVLPSVEEGFGITLVEALASGRPVVASDIPTFRLIGEGGPARLIDFRTTDAAQQAVQEAVTSWDVDSARAAAERYSWTELTPRFMDLYHSVLRA